MKPMYYINIAGVNLHNVENIHDENGREISTYDGVGIGKFNVPESKTPHSWKFDCELWQDGNLLKSMNTWSASEIFKLLDSLLGTNEPSRFVVTSQFYPAVNFSTLVWFKRYIKDESYPGVYKASIEVEEYKPSGIKTTDIPYVARPGKLPVVPRIITVTSSKAAYGATKKYTGNTPKPGEKGFIGPVQTNTKINFSDFKSGKPVTNPATIKAGQTYITKPAPSYSGVLKTGIPINGPQLGRVDFDAIDPWVKSVQNAFSSIGNGLQSFIDKNAASIANIVQR